jgi:small subunit ribosomal protein S9
MNFLKTYTHAIGKRKTASAKALIKEGNGIILINEKLVEDYFSNLIEAPEKINRYLVLSKSVNHFDIDIFVKGGGISSQLDAICLAIAKAICKIKIDCRSIFNKFLLLRSDSRIKERRKYGLKKARKASQYSKR